MNKNALTLNMFKQRKSCAHKVVEAVQAQVSRLLAGGYRRELVDVVASRGLQRLAGTARHRNREVKYREGVVYGIPLTCGFTYVGQTGRCVNDRLLEHKRTT
ncbi:uncharacterized protein LOC121838103 [Ixodes scapularis]|uniref:uncharacterized protein LOC121838103 n=1 Tax=Ixodes scapularis TaxID=6945 RepID=UPI001C38BC08|nr:uncharacterized protein LOC121838103 [Ixodes scapularis]